MKNIRMLTSVLASMLCCWPAQAGSPLQPRAVEATDEMFVKAFGTFLTDAMARLDTIPALSVVVVRGDGPLLVTTIGKADLEKNISATVDTRFYIASSTKAFVGTVMALLDARGTIDLDWTLAQLAPDTDFAPEVRAEEVTLRHLLSHTHGLVGDAIEFRLAYSGEHDPETLWGQLAFITANRDHPLGTFNYGNLGYNLATLLVERKIGRRWQEIVATEILNPLEMDQTATEGLEAARSSNSFAEPYLGLGTNGPERLYLVKWDDTMQSAGGMYSSARDMARWLAFEVAAARSEVDGELSQAAVAAQTPVATLDANFGPFRRTGYGLGWYSGPYQGKTLYHAFGSFSGSRAHVSALPSQNLGVAILTNDEGVGFQFVDVAAAFAYDWFTIGPEAATERGEEMVDGLAALAEQRRKQIAAARAELEEREWQLTLARAAYAGRFCSAAYGTISVMANDERILVEMGRLQSVATPFTAPDTIRLELIPNSGIVLGFQVEGGAVRAVKGFGATFERCG